MLHWCDHPHGQSPLGYVAMLRYDTAMGIWPDVSDAGAMTRALLDTGALVESDPDDVDTPLVTAASYGDPEVLIEAGADLAATASVTADAVRGGTALRHAAVFGMTDVAAVPMAAGATDLVAAAAMGDISPGLSSRFGE